MGTAGVGAVVGDHPARIVVGRHDAQLHPLKRRLLTASDLLTTPFKMGHRGGSQHWPECTEVGYTRAAALGTDVLEFSVGRSSDGVFFGLHDETIDRVCDGTGTASAMTWAQIDSYQVNHPPWPGVGPQPWYRVEDFVTKFAGTHVLMIDPKFTYADGYSSDLWDLVLSLTTADRIVYKFSGNSSGPATEASNRGLVSWGYLYDSQQASFGTYANYSWDMLGLNYDASQAVWDDLASYGKPIVAHVIMDQSSWEDARAKGAHAAQCGRPDVVDLSSLYIPDIPDIPAAPPELVWRGVQDAAASVDMPASGIQAGDTILVWHANKPAAYPEAVAFSHADFTEVGKWDGGGYAAAPGAGTGDVQCRVQSRVADGTENGQSYAFAQSGISSAFVLVEVWRGAATATAVAMGEQAVDGSASLSFTGGSLPASSDGDVLSWMYVRTDDSPLPVLSSPAVSGGGATWSSESVNVEDDYTPGFDVAASLLSAVSGGGTGGTVSWTATVATAPAGWNDLRGVAGGVLLTAA